MIQPIYRPVLIIWAAALFAGGMSLLLLRDLPFSSIAILGALLIAIFMSYSDHFAVELENRHTTSAAPAFLVCGLVVCGWPLLPLAVLLGSLAPIVTQRRPVDVVLRVAGARSLAVMIAAPIFYATLPEAALPFSTPLALLGLLLIGIVCYGIEILVASGRGRASLMTIWPKQRGVLRWYVLATLPLGAVLGLLWAVNPMVFLLGLAPLAVVQHIFRSQVELHQTTTDFAQLAVQREALATRLERLLALSTTMMGTQNIQAMLELLCVRLAALLDAPHGWVVLFDEQDRPRLMATYNLKLSEEANQTFADPDSYGLLLRRGVVTLLTDERRHDLAPWAVSPDSSRWLGVLAIPLVAEQRLLGAICLSFNRLRGLEIDEQRILTSFALQAAMTLENARLFEELKLKQAELVQSSKLAAVGTFAAGIAHEFNNLLGGMLGYAELGARTDDMAEKNQALEVVIQACWRGSRITRGLLTFARQQKQRRTLADVTEAVNETLLLVEPDLRKARVEIVRQLEPVPMTVCDLGQIAQVVLNLITNARDAMQPDGGMLTISLREEHEVIELSVNDTGSGIPEEIRDKIFDPFVTTKGALGSSRTPGTGLGLSVSYGIVKEHGGTIKVNSVAGHGTTMTICLPVTDDGLEEEEVEQEREYGRSSV